MDFHQASFIVIWETTQACDLACVHCSAKAQPLPLPGELSHKEGLALLDEISEMGAKVCVLSGGDSLKRADLLDLIRHGRSKGLRMATIPAATPVLTGEVVWALKDAGLDQMALSLDAVCLRPTIGSEESMGRSRIRWKRSNGPVTRSFPSRSTAS